jgi:hypothetical protein
VCGDCGSRSSQTDSGNHLQPNGLEFSWGCPFGFMMPTATDIGADFRFGSRGVALTGRPEMISLDGELGLSMCKQIVVMDGPKT